MRVEFRENVTLHGNLMLKVKARSRHACTTRLACHRSRICAYLIEKIKTDTLAFGKFNTLDLVFFGSVP